MTELAKSKRHSLLLRALKSVWFKVAVTAAVLWALFYFNRIEISEFSHPLKNWIWLVAAFLFMLPPYLIVSIRFHYILKSMGIETGFHNAVRWTMIGSFFDIAMPSSSGGDIVKAGYVMSYVGTGTRTKALMAVVFDRAFGLLGLFFLAGISSLTGWAVVRAMPGSDEVLIFIFSVCFGSLIGFRLMGSRRLHRSPKFRSLVHRVPFGDKLFSFMTCFNLLRERPATLVLVLGLSVLNHLFWCSALLCISIAFTQEINTTVAFTVFPLAIFSNVFGFAGGFGVGTAAFDVIFTSLLGIGAGAAIGLTFQTLNACSRLLGLPFYLAAKGQSSTHAEAPGAARISD